MPHSNSKINLLIDTLNLSNKKKSAAEALLEINAKLSRNQSGSESSLLLNEADYDNLDANRIESSLRSSPSLLNESIDEEQKVLKDLQNEDSDSNG
jgi:hypothetical protein